MGLNPKGRDWGPLVNWDSLGKAYAGMIIAWTILLIAGSLWLVSKRRVPFIKMRNLPLALASTLFLHVYLVKIMLAYTTNGHFQCSAEFWIMSIYLPFGIALFQANVTQIRTISDRQGRLLLRQTSQSSLESTAPSARSSRPGSALWRGWTALSEVQRSYVYIVVFMLLQLIMSAAIYATSPVLQGDWRSFGHIPFNKGQAKCRKSLSWVPSAFWQLFWSWCYGPWILYKIRHVRDTHHWRLQTILSVVSGLPGVPLWIAAVFSLHFKKVNLWFVPPMWLAPCIVVMQACAIFMPIYEYWENSRAIYEIWSDTASGTTRPSVSDSSTTSLRPATKESADLSAQKLFQELASHAKDNRDLYRMPALEKALEINPATLLQFAATQDFTAENIIFLLQIKTWHAAWRRVPRDPDTGELTPMSRSRLFSMGLYIFRTSVSSQTAEFPINVEDHIARKLASIFAPHTRKDSAHSNSHEDTKSLTTAWQNDSYSNSSADQTEEAIELVEDGKIQFGVGIVRTASPLPSPPISSWQLNPLAEKGNQIPDLDPKLVHPELEEGIFDQAEASIKYLVLTNTWRKFVQKREDAAIA